jgi:hypothetical protein
MVRVTVEVSSGGACFSVDVSADSIKEAVRLAGRRYPGCKAQVLFPIEPEAFFAKPDVTVTMDRTVLVDTHEDVSGGPKPDNPLWELALEQLIGFDPLSRTDQS